MDNCTGYHVISRHVCMAYVLCVCVCCVHACMRACVLVCVREFVWKGVLSNSQLTEPLGVPDRETKYGKFDWQPESDPAQLYPGTFHLAKVHMHACTHSHTHLAKVHMMMGASMCENVCACVCVHACMHACVHVGTNDRAHGG